MKNITEMYGLNEQHILKQIRSEQSEGLNAVETKRRLRAKDLKDYVPTTKNNKVSINLIYTTVQTRMSVYYSDRMNVEWKARKETGRGIASNLTRLAEFDYSEMNLEVLNYQWYWDSEVLGVGIKVIDGWDKETSTPMARIMSPLSWVPDPRGDFTGQNHRWAGFQVEESLGVLKVSKHYSNVEMINSEVDLRQNEIRRAYTDGRSIIDQGYEQVDNKNYPLYHHYTIIGGYKYVCTTANDNSLLIRIVRLEPITKAEKENPLLVPFPFALLYSDPVKGDPFGISIPDKLRDKQQAKSKLFNLAVKKETRNSL
jgi:hypothetical protein